MSTCCVASDNGHGIAVGVIRTGLTLGCAARRYCGKRGLPFTTSVHTRVPEYIHARSGVLDEDLGAAAMRALEIPSARCRDDAQGFSWRRCAEQFLKNLRPNG